MKHYFIIASTLLFCINTNAGSPDTKDVSESGLAHSLKHLDMANEKIDRQIKSVEAKHRILDVKQKIYNANLSLFEAKQRLLESRLERINLETISLELSQQKISLGRKSIESELIFPDIKSTIRRKLEKELEEIIKEEKVIDEELSSIRKKIKNVERIMVSQQSEAAQLAKEYFELKSSIKTN